MRILTNSRYMRTMLQPLLPAAYIKLTHMCTECIVHEEYDVYLIDTTTHVPIIMYSDEKFKNPMLLMFKRSYKERALIEFTRVLQQLSNSLNEEYIQGINDPI